jgi:hypothetical protein
MCKTSEKERSYLIKNITLGNQIKNYSYNAVPNLIASTNDTRAKIRATNI